MQAFIVGLIVGGMLGVVISLFMKGQDMPCEDCVYNNLVRDSLNSWENNQDQQPKPIVDDQELTYVKLEKLPTREPVKKRFHKHTKYYK